MSDAAASGVVAKWFSAYERALRSHDAAGYYNRNARVAVDGRAVVVRVPIPGAPEMDLRLLPEGPVLGIVRRAGVAVPEVLYESTDPAFAVHEYISGHVVNDVAPRGTLLPRHVIQDVVDAIVALHRVERVELPSMPRGWPRDGESSQMALRFLDHTQRIFDNAREDYGTIYDALGVPAYPLEEVRQRLLRLHMRPFHLVHADIHRKNLIIGDGKTWLLDWELALWGDPLYEVAVHLHKMKYRPEEERRFIDALFDSHAANSLGGSEDDLEALLLHERAKSVIVDTIRYTTQVRCESANATSLSVSLASKLVDALPLWQNEPLTPEAVHDILRHG